MQGTKSTPQIYRWDWKVLRMVEHVSDCKQIIMWMELLFPNNNKSSTCPQRPPLFIIWYDCKDDLKKQVHPCIVPKFCALTSAETALSGFSRLFSSASSDLAPIGGRGSFFLISTSSMFGAEWMSSVRSSSLFESRWSWTGPSEVVVLLDVGRDGEFIPRAKWYSVSYK